MAVFLGHFFSPIVSQPVAKAWSLSVVFGAAGILMLTLALGFILANSYVMHRAQQWQRIHNQKNEVKVTLERI